MTDTTPNPTAQVDLAIRVRALSKTVEDSSGPLTILHNIDLDVPRGASLAIVGAVGSGKSTLL